MGLPSLADLYSAFDSDPAPIASFLRELAIGFDLPQPLDVLDVGCGPGRLFSPLRQLQWAVTGMEPDPDFLAAAKAAAQSSRRAGVRQGGFLEVDQEIAFDLVIGVNSSFAHLLTPDDRDEALLRIHRALRPGGVVFLDLPDFLWILRHYREPEPHTAAVHGLEVTLYRRHEMDYDAATLTTTDTYRFGQEGAPPISFVHRYGIVTRPELIAGMRRAGFDEIRSFTDYGSGPDELPSGRRMMLAGRKVRSAR